MGNLFCIDFVIVKFSRTFIASSSNAGLGWAGLGGCDQSAMEMCNGHPGGHMDTGYQEWGFHV